MTVNSKEYKAAQKAKNHAMSKMAERMADKQISMREHMSAICLEVLGEAHYNAVALPEAMKSTALILFLSDEQSTRAHLVRTALKALEETGVIK